MDQSNYKGELTQIHEYFSLKIGLDVLVVILALLIPIGLVSGDDEIALFEHRSLVRPGEYDSLWCVTHSCFLYFGVGYILDPPSQNKQFRMILLDEAAYANFTTNQPYTSLYEKEEVYEQRYHQSFQQGSSGRGFEHEGGLAAGQYLFVVDNTLGNETLGINLRIAFGSSFEEIEPFLEEGMEPPAYASWPSFFFLVLSTGVIFMVLRIQHKKNHPSKPRACF